MSAQSEFQLKEKLHDGRNTLVRRAIRSADAKPVVLKILKEPYASSETLARFKREYEMTASLNAAASANERIDGVIAAFSFETLDNLPVIILEDFDGVSLDIHHRRWALGDFFKLALQVVEALGQVHSRQIMHKDINPSNIVYNVRTGEAKLIDFGISTLLPRETIAPVSLNVLEGTLAYISPEQTGRINRSVDYRTDFYSLGVTFYELLTTRLPFEEEDLLALIHSHLAKQPVPPHEINPTLPVAVSNIVMKLLAKNAEDRYQSAYGLKADLLECQRQWQTGQVIREFPLGEKDIPDRFQISQKLFGREAEIATLLSAYENTQRGAYEIFLFSGLAGMGKTALVNELQIPVTQKNGYFVSGRYRQAQNQVPYSALIDALRLLIQQLLSESETQLGAWQKKLAGILGNNGRIITDLIPESTLILGSQPPLQSLSASEEQNRFNLTLHDFICAFMSEDHPLVLFLDDLQWADTASVSFLQRFASSADLQHVMLISAYRTNEIDENHPLKASLKQLMDTTTHIHEMELMPLQLQDIQDLLVRSLNCSAEELKPLAGITMMKTGGNPFFINEFLRGIYNDGLLKFDMGHGGWVWDLRQIQTRQLADRVMDVLSGKIDELPEEAQKLLRLAACIGDTFDLSLLAVLSHRTKPETASALWPALASGLIFPLTQNYIFAEQPDADAEVRYSFSHSGIQQEIYTLLPTTEKSSTHWQIAQHFLEQIPADQREGRIFELVNHFNTGSSNIQTHEQRLLIADLNLLASQKTFLSAAQEASLKYAKEGLDQLQALESQGIDIWKDQYPLTFDMLSMPPVHLI